MMMTWAFQRTAENLHMPVTLMTHRFQRHSSVPVTTAVTDYCTTTQVSLSLTGSSIRSPWEVTQKSSSLMQYSDSTVPVTGDNDHPSTTQP
ncbi:hypothetical protein DPX16_7313 [Anabarilius grahami]|uniref:Uncharacterized protein n=1 Tax=Anabarilius grahami TaxID=495550 RepID=A0A3N0Z229_ANAGA|nr:hypothetical protein DPX16_7313 [Anabarilius grahami]